MFALAVDVVDKFELPTLAPSRDCVGVSIRYRFVFPVFVSSDVLSFRLILPQRHCQLSARDVAELQSNISLWRLE